jgi:hypothetical protein
MTTINRLAQALGYVKLAKQSIDLAPTAEFYEVYALEKLNEVESALITGITDTWTPETLRETLQAEIQSLKERVTALEQIEKKRMYDEAYDDYLSGKFDEIIESSAKKREKEIRKSNAQLTRDDIIEMAKRDVVELKDPHSGFYIVDHVFDCYADFKINREKRTVVALLRGEYSGKVLARGIAKCHPDDCFNAAIGRAIALRRALGLEVPEAYLNAPQPTEVRVGDVIRNKYTGWTHRVTRENWRGFISEGFDIIDDSREEV